MQTLLLCIKEVEASFSVEGSKCFWDLLGDVFQVVVSTIVNSKLLDKIDENLVLVIYESLPGER